MRGTEENYYKTSNIWGVMDRIVTSNPYEEVSSGDYEYAVISVGDTNSFHRIRPSITPGLTYQYIQFSNFSD
jgi:hypothetical protein